MSALIVTHSDIGRHLFTEPDLDTVSEGGEIDTEVVILLDVATNTIGYLDIRDHMQGKGDDGRVFGNFRKATVMTINDSSEQLFETQEEAIRAALASERAYADHILRKCEEIENRLLKVNDSE